MPENKLLDSNVLVYAFDSSEKERHKAAKTLFETCLDRKERFFISLQNMSEFYSIVTTSIENPLPRKEARKICQKILAFSGFIKIAPAGETIIEAMRLNDLYAIPYWDALIVATMRENKTFIIYTENVRDFEKVPGIRIINPFV